MLTTSAIQAIAVDNPIFLTNATLDDVGHLTLDDLHSLGLPTGTDYPLTLEESARVAEDYLDIADNIGATMGYTVLWRRYKWFLPEIEVFFKCDANPAMLMSEADAEDLARAMASALEARLASFGVVVRFISAQENPEPDRHTIRPFFPASFVVRYFASYDAWRRWLYAMYTRALQEREAGVPEIVPGIPMPAALSLGSADVRHCVSIAWETVTTDPIDAVRAFVRELTAPDASGHAFCVTTPTTSIMVQLSAAAEGGYDCWTALKEYRLTGCSCGMH